eukprot:2441325-Pleurochrysis_carterae.AAC.2
MQYFSGGSSITVELGPQPPASNSFGLMGTGSLSLAPKITCERQEAPPPSPPSSKADCSIGSGRVGYSFVNAWNNPLEGKDVEQVELTLPHAVYNSAVRVTLTYYQVCASWEGSIGSVRPNLSRVRRLCRCSLESLSRCRLENTNKEAASRAQMTKHDHSGRNRQMT